MKKPPSDNQKSDSPPYIFICVPLWQEDEIELETITRSLFRMIKKQTNKRGNYDLEVHIFFDTPFEASSEESECKTVNEWVSCFINVLRTMLEENGNVDCWEHGEVFSTPYGGKIIFDILETEFTIHLKDPGQVKRGKRWSQIMYMYYLCDWKLERMTSSNGEKLSKENSFILALDGDVEFFPKDVELVLARMLSAPDIGACCNQIHPNGSGPLIWFQKFEYAALHWFQKATEHLFGCVLCSPGCFSLLRISNLLNKNVMKTYRKNAKDSTTKLIYDQGEDRWLCTLIILSGGRIEYEARSHCKTFAPDDLDTFFKQRRRWGPSIFVNTYQLISSKKFGAAMTPIFKTANIVYHMLSLALSSIGVTTTLFFICDGLDIRSGISTDQIRAFVYLPVVLYSVICWKASDRTQLRWAKILSALYSLVMVLIVFTINMSGGSCNLTYFLIIFFAGTHLVAALLHWDFNALICGIIYWLCIPMNFVFLQIYMIANINDMSWGTRSASTSPKKRTAEKQVVVQETTREKPVFSSSEESSLVESNASYDGMTISEARLRNRFNPPLKWATDLSSPFSDKTKIYSLPNAEKVFWDKVIGFLAAPSSAEKKTARINNERMAQQLTAFRNKIAGAVIVINIIFFFSASALKLRSPIYQTFIYLPFIILMSMQTICMFIHRWSTLARSFKEYISVKHSYLKNMK